MNGYIKGVGNNDATVKPMDNDCPNNQSNNIRIDENEKQGLKRLVKPLKRVSTSQSNATSNTDAMSVRSKVMQRMNFKKIAKKDQSNVPSGPDYHAMDLAAVTEILKTDVDDGLTDAEAAERLSKYGRNELSGEGGVSVWKVLFRQLFNVMILILVIAMVSISYLSHNLWSSYSKYSIPQVVSLVFKDWIEGGVTAAIIILNAGIGFMQEFKAEKTMESLRRLASPTSKVVRHGHLVTVPTRDLVSGDILSLKQGDVVGADCRIIE